MRDLLLLVADKNMEFAVAGVLRRYEALGIRSVDFEVKVHAERDGGVRTTGAEILTRYAGSFQLSLMMLDLEGSGSKCIDAVELETELDRKLELIWGDRAKSIVIEPEVDIWLWGSDTALQNVLRWSKQIAIRRWLQNCGFLIDDNGKPIRPKEAFEIVLRECRCPRSSSIYQKITSTISLRNCTDSAFQRLAGKVREWFAA